MTIIITGYSSDGLEDNENLRDVNAWDRDVKAGDVSYRVSVFERNLTKLETKVDLGSQDLNIGSTVSRPRWITGLRFSKTRYGARLRGWRFLVVVNTPS